MPSKMIGWFWVLCFVIVFSLSMGAAADAIGADVTLAWDPNSEPDLAGYKLHYGTASHAYTSTVDVGKRTTTNVPDLAEGLTYYFAVTAYNSSGASSGYSNEVSYRVPVVDTDGDGLSDVLEVGTYGTDHNLADTDGDGISDGQEVALWGLNWNADIDGDGVINLLDWDADGDGFSDGEEVAKSTDPADGGIKPAALPMETGEVKVWHEWKKVSFARQFCNPSVVACGMSANGGNPAVVRIRNVTGSGFEIRIQEWDGYDGMHVAETVGYLAVERGVHTLAGSVKVEAGRFAFSKGGVLGARSFQQIFPEIPVVMASAATFNDPAAVEVRLNQITTKGFNLRLQEQEANVQDHGTEIIHYIAWQPSSGSFDGIRFEVDKTAKAVSNGFSKILFSEPYAAGPVFLEKIQSQYGSDPATVQWRAKDAEGVEVKIAEETSRDQETLHVLEVLGYMAFSGSP
jgi:hypothetical protein